VLVSAAGENSTSFTGYLRQRKMQFIDLEPANLTQEGNPLYAGESLASLLC
jgi:hypothetical protein